MHLTCDLNRYFEATNGFQTGPPDRHWARGPQEPDSSSGSCAMQPCKSAAMDGAGRNRCPQVAATGSREGIPLANPYWHGSWILGLVWRCQGQRRSPRGGSLSCGCLGLCSDCGASQRRHLLLWANRISRCCCWAPVAMTCSFRGERCPAY